jgi:3-oxoadipate enol-lactonase
LNTFIVNNLHVFDSGGTNEPLIFVHAFPLSSKMWKHQVEYFKNKYRVITYDIRGLGDSKVNDNLYMMETFVFDFFAVLDKLNINKVTACGLSMGGYIILRALIKSPKRFKAVILADTKAERDDDEVLINRSQSIIQIENNGLKAFLENFIKRLITEESYKNPEILNFLKNILQDQTPKGICGAQIAIATRTETLEQLKNITIPALIIVGEDDVITPVKFAINLKNKLINSNLVVVPDASHLSNIENHEFFNNAVSIFIDNLN